MANRAAQIAEDKNPKSYETRVAEYLLKNNLTLPKNNEISSIQPKVKRKHRKNNFLIKKIMFLFSPRRLFPLKMLWQI